MAARTTRRSFFLLFPRGLSVLLRCKHLLHALATAIPAGLGLNSPGKWCLDFLILNICILHLPSVPDLPQHCTVRSNSSLWPTHLEWAARLQRCAGADRLVDYISCFHLSVVYSNLSGQRWVSPTQQHCCDEQPSGPCTTFYWLPLASLRSSFAKP